MAAEDGLEALHLLRAVKRREPQTPCLVLLDLMMPRLGGPEFRRAQLGDPAVARAELSSALSANPYFSFRYRDEAQRKLAELGGPVR